MIVDFQHHFTPRELINEDPGDQLVLNYDALGAPSYTVHSLLYDLDEHVRMMDLAGIDAAWLTSATGMCADLERSRFVNDKAKQAEQCRGDCGFLHDVNLLPGCWLYASDTCCLRLRPGCVNFPGDNASARDFYPGSRTRPPKCKNRRLASWL